MASKKLFVAVPVYGALEPNFTLCIIHLVTQRPCELGLDFKIGDSLVSRARNALVAKFLASDCTDLLFIDSDLIFSVEHIKRMISHEEDVVGGFYLKKKQGNPEFVCNTFPDLQPPNERGLQKVKYMGTGFLKISRRAFETMIAKFGDDLWYHPDETPPETREYDFFTVGVYRYPDGTRRYLSEDWYFCQRWLDCGGEVWADTHICCKHVGPTTFPLQTQEPHIFGPKPDTAGGAAVDATALPAISLPAGFVVPPEMALSSKERGPESHEILNGCYDIPGLREPPKTALDAGAHVGLFTHWAKKKWPDCKVTAYEPEAQNFQWLYHNVHSLPGVQLIQSALSNHNNELKLHKGRNSLTHSVRGEGAEFTVPCKDAATIGRFDFVKVDTEGSEGAILAAMDLSQTKAVVVETHPGGMGDQIIDNLLGPDGFKLVSSEPTIHGCRLLKFAKPEALKETV